LIGVEGDPVHRLRLSLAGTPVKLRTPLMQPFRCGPFTLGSCRPNVGSYPKWVLGMKIKSVNAYWVHIPIPPDKQHTSDFGRTLSFDGTLVRIDTECGLVGWGEAKAQVGGMA